MRVLYSESARWRRLHIAAAGGCALATILALYANWRWAPFGLAGLGYCCHRALLYAQQIELTPNGIISHSRFGERRLAYRDIGAMRFGPLTGDLLLERRWVRLRIPPHFQRRDEIRRAVSLAVWAHRGGDIPPDFAEPGSAFG